MGHSALRCKNPKKCGWCWGDGHIGSFCNQQQLNLAARSFSPENNTKKRGEPSFAELLESPVIARGLPENRPQKIVCFVERDEEYYEERRRLEKAVVMHNPEVDFDMTVEEIAEYAATSGVVKAEEVQAGIMTISRYVIILPENIEPASFIRSIPLEVWNKGFSFSLWSPLTDYTMAMPHFKVMLDLVGIPLDLYREKEVIRAVSSIGIYLGTVEKPMEGGIAYWTVVVATTDLALIPHQIGYIIEGRETIVEVILRTWMHCEVYSHDELPKQREQFLPPNPPPSLPSEMQTGSEEDQGQNNPSNVEDEFVGSRKVLTDV